MSLLIKKKKTDNDKLDRPSIKLENLHFVMLCYVQFALAFGRCLPFF